MAERPFAKRNVFVPTSSHSKSVFRTEADSRCFGLSDHYSRMRISSQLPFTMTAFTESELLVKGRPVLSSRRT